MEVWKEIKEKRRQRSKVRKVRWRKTRKRAGGK